MSFVYKPGAGRLATAVRIGLFALAASGTGVATAQAAAASQQAVQSYDIAAGSLTEVLSRFASAAGAAISFTARKNAGQK